MGSEKKDHSHKYKEYEENCLACKLLKQISELQAKYSALKLERDALFSEQIKAHPFYYKEWENFQAQINRLKLDFTVVSKRNAKLEAYISDMESQKECALSHKIADLEQKLFLKDQVLDADEKRVYELEQKLAQVTQEKKEIK